MAVIDVKGTFVTVDDDDVDFLSKHKWWMMPQGYAVTRIKRQDGSRRTIGMHRIIMGDPDSLVIDHINRVKTDNRRSNLRACTHGENLRNKPAMNGCASQHKGVSLGKNGKWQVVVRVSGSLKWLGYHKTEIEAAKVAAPYFSDFPT